MKVYIEFDVTKDVDKEAVQRALFGLQDAIAPQVPLLKPKRAGGASIALKKSRGHRGRHCLRYRAKWNAVEVAKLTQAVRQRWPNKLRHGELKHQARLLHRSPSAVATCVSMVVRPRVKAQTEADDALKHLEA